MRGIDIITATATATDRHRSATLLGLWAALALVWVLALGMASTASAAAPLSWSPPQPIVSPGVSDLSHAACGALRVFRERRLLVAIDGSG